MIKFKDATGTLVGTMKDEDDQPVFKAETIKDSTEEKEEDKLETNESK